MVTYYTIVFIRIYLNMKDYINILSYICVSFSETQKITLSSNCRTFHARSFVHNKRNYHHPDRDDTIFAYLDSFEDRLEIFQKEFNWKWEALKSTAYIYIEANKQAYKLATKSVKGISSLLTVVSTYILADIQNEALSKTEGDCSSLSFTTHITFPLVRILQYHLSVRCIHYEIIQSAQQNYIIYSETNYYLYGYKFQHFNLHYLNV